MTTFEQGHAAFYAAVDLDDNPYAKGGDDHYFWQEGWFHAFEQWEENAES